MSDFDEILRFNIERVKVRVHKAQETWELQALHQPSTALLPSYTKEKAPLAIQDFIHRHLLILPLDRMSIRDPILGNRRRHETVPQFLLLLGWLTIYRRA